MKNEIQTLAGQGQIIGTSQRAQIISICFGSKDNYVNYSDTDASADYFNGYSLTTRDTIEWVKEDGADRIRVYFTNSHILSEEQRNTFMKRLDRIAKAINYKIEPAEHGDYMLVREAV